MSETPQPPNEDDIKEPTSYEGEDVDGDVQDPDVTEATDE